jgi:hypothetical protein
MQMTAADAVREPTTGEQRRRVAFCECGAQLSGGTEAELFAATQWHLAHHHPQLLGAMERETVAQMAEAVGGRRRRGREPGGAGTR